MDAHAHEPFDVPAGFTDPLGRPVAHDLLGRVIAAAFDGCTSCQTPLLDRLTQDPVTTLRLVELACVATHSALGGLPDSLLDPTVPGMASVEFRLLASSGVEGHNDAMLTTTTGMTPAQRRAAAETALDILIGHLATS